MDIDERYKEGKIYRLVCSETLNIYYGSTIQKLNIRLYKHRCKCNNCESRFFVNPIIELVEDYPCNNSRELEKREQYFIDNYECVNINKSYISEEDRKEYIKKFSKKYHQDNKEKINEYSRKYYKENKKEMLESMKKYSKKYYNDNKEIINEKQKKYKLDNKEKISENNKKYYQDNKEKVSEKGKEKMICECGREVRKSNLTRHKKTKKHLNNLNNNINGNI